MLAQIMLVEQFLLHIRDLNRPAYASLLLRNGQDLHGVEIQPLTRNTITELSAMYDELVFDIHGRVPYAISKELGFNVREA